MGSIIKVTALMMACLPLGSAAQQAGCPNIGFENGDFTGWTGGTGSCCPIVISNTNIVPQGPFTNGRHTIMSGPGTDPTTNGAITVVAPGGGTYSARLGNNDVTAQAERLRYSMTVDAGNALFVYRYAVVLENPHHDVVGQPRFEISMFTQNNTEIACGMYNVYATSNLPGFVIIPPNWYSTDSIVYKDWTTVGVDLSSYIGQQVTIEFRTGDCAHGAHFGYAYIDASCGPLEIISDFCPGIDTATVMAPPGFEYLWSTGETTQSITIVDPVAGQPVSCTLTSITGCQVTLTAVMTPSVLLADFTYEGSCMNDVQFTSNAQVVSGPPIVSWNWLFDDSTTSTEQDPFHAWGASGSHWAQLVVESTAGCVDTLLQTFDLIPSPVASFTHTLACEGGEVVFTDTSPVVNSVVMRQWDFGDGNTAGPGETVPHVYDTGSTYEVSLFVQDSNGCGDSATIPLMVHSLPAFDLGPDIAVCENVPVVLNAQNAGLPFEWSTGQNTQSIQVTETGNVWVTITLPSGCAVSDTVHVQLHPLPVPLFSDTMACAGPPLLLDAGNPGCTYLWSTGGTTQQIVVQEVSGNYSVNIIGVVITSPNGCTTNYNALVTFMPSIVAELGADQVLCEGDTWTLDVWNPDATYLWSDGSSAPTLDVTTTGTYTVHVTNGYCTASDTVHLTFGTFLIAQQLADTVLCVEQVLYLDAGNLGCTYLWSTGETTQQIAVQGVGGSYSVAITSPGGCATTGNTTLVDSALVTFMPSIVVELGADQALCEGDVWTLDAGNPGATYLWSDGSSGPTLDVTTTGTYTVHVTNGYCAASDTVHLTFGTSPIAQLADTVLCVEQVLYLDAGNPGCTYLWSTGETTQQIAVQGGGGNYSVIITNPDGCAINDNALVTFMPSIVVELGADQALCEGDVWTLDAGNPGATYLWSDGSSGPSLDVTATGTYTVHVTNGYCMASDSVYLTFGTSPIAQLVDTVLCVEQVLYLDAGNPGCTYLWSTGETTQQIAVQGVGGNYGVVITNPDGCSSSADMDVLFMPSIMLELGAGPALCEGEVWTLDASNPGATYQWSDGSSGPSLDVTATGTYTVHVTNGYCMASDSVYLTFGTSPIAQLVDTVLCVEQVLYLDAGNPGCTYLWSTGETTQQIAVQGGGGNYSVAITNPGGCAIDDNALVTFMPSIVLDLGADSVLCEGDVWTLDASNPGATYLWSDGSSSPTLHVTTTGTYSVHVTNGYCSGDGTISAVFMPYPLYSLPAVIDTCLEVPGSGVTLEAGPIGQWFLWSTGDTTRAITVRESGVYTLQTTSPPRCTIEESVLLREQCVPRVFVPNTFTPNSDGTNDLFLPVSYSILGIELLVFDRWGGLVYEGDGQTGGWDGMHDGHELPIGVYNWRFTFRDILNVDGALGHSETIVGHVTLVR